MSRADHYASLDAIRGLASFVVLISHGYLAFLHSSPFWRGLFWDGPLLIFINSNAAVITFFVLSGFVLHHASFRGPELPPYMGFAIRRICRIYIPFAVAVLAAALLFSISSHDRAGTMTSLHEHAWKDRDVTWFWVARHLLMTGVFDDTLLDPPVWTLVHELRISLLFPLLVMMCRSSWFGAASIPAIMLAAIGGSAYWGQYLFFPAALNVFSSLMATLIYVPCFIMGILLSKHAAVVTDLLKGLSAYAKAGILTVAFIPLCIKTEFLVGYVLHALAATIIIALAIAWEGWQRMLSRGIFTWLGRVSYSLYLVNFPLILVCAELFYGLVPQAIIFSVALVSSLLTAAFMQRYVEVPAIGLGKKLAGFSTRLWRAKCKENTQK